MGNIFENAYFGKPYKTRDGRKAIYIGESMVDKGAVQLLHEGLLSIYKVMRNGQFWAIPNIESFNDIVSEWQEEIDEKKLDEIASMEFYKDQTSCYNELDIYKTAFKTGYRKALDNK